MTNQQLLAIGQLTAARRTFAQAIDMILSGSSIQGVRPLLESVELPRLPYKWDHEK